MNVRGRNPFGIKRASDEVIATCIRPRLKRFVYRFKINDASFLNLERTSLESAENRARKYAKRSKDNLGTIKLISITKVA